MSDCCSNCGDEFGYDVGWDDPPQGEGHIEVTFNPADEPSFVVGETTKYCSIECLIEDSGELPFDTPDDHRLAGAEPAQVPNDAPRDKNGDAVFDEVDE